MLCLLPSASTSSPTLTWLLVGPGCIRITQSRESWVPYPAPLLPAGAYAGSPALASRKKVSLLLNLFISTYLLFFHFCLNYYYSQCVFLRSFSLEQDHFSASVPPSL